MRTPTAPSDYILVFLVSRLTRAESSNCKVSFSRLRRRYAPHHLSPRVFRTFLRSRYGYCKEGILQGQKPVREQKLSSWVTIEDKPSIHTAISNTISEAHASNNGQCKLRRQEMSRNYRGTAAKGPSVSHRQVKRSPTKRRSRKQSTSSVPPVPPPIVNTSQVPGKDSFIHERYAPFTK